MKNKGLIALFTFIFVILTIVSTLSVLHKKKEKESAESELSYYKEFYVWVADNHNDVYREFFEPTEEQIREADLEWSNK